MSLRRIRIARAWRVLLTGCAVIVGGLPMLATRPADAQAPTARDSARRSAAAPAHVAAPPGIQDNLFLLEEAYNQDAGVVQHISQFQRDLRAKAYTFQFTQEWPVGGITHQLSYGVPIVRPDAATGVGVGDIRLNYRYQLIGDADARFAVSPRATVVLPTGDYRRARGAGATGYEVWLPASVVLSDRWVVHGNAGLTRTPRARNVDGDRATTNTWTFGGSVVWLARPAFNLFIETIYQPSEDVAAPGQTARSNNFTVSPGVRWAYNFSSGLQIVPGIAVPLGAGPSAGERSVLFYLSFEHPFTNSAREKARAE
ncbi:MAG: transporter [Gemmatimonadaceae bacterium]